MFLCTEAPVENDEIVVKALRAERGGEYLCPAFKNFKENQDIQNLLTAAHTSQKNDK